MFNRKNILFYCAFVLLFSFSFSNPVNASTPDPVVVQMDQYVLGPYGVKSDNFHLDSHQRLLPIKISNHKEGDVALRYRVYFESNGPEECILKGILAPGQSFSAQLEGVNNGRYYIVLEADIDSAPNFTPGFYPEPAHCKGSAQLGF